MKLNIKPETIKYILIPVALFVILIVLLLTTRQERLETTDPIIPVPITEIIKTDSSRKVIYANTESNKKMIIQLDKNATEAEIKSELNISDEEFENAEVIIPTSLTGRQMTSQQVDYEDYMYNQYLEYLKSPGYVD